MRFAISFAFVVATIHLATFADAPGEKLDAYCQAITSSGFSGTVLAIREGQQVLQKGYGLADRHGSIANSPETLFEIASLSKQFTAAAILKLETLGKLSTDEPMERYLPVPKAYEGITIYHLLTHTGGLPPGGGGRGMDLARAVGDHLVLPPKQAPGKKFAYSNVDYAPLAGIVEIASGQKFETFCREQLFVPAGMQNTGFCGETFAGNKVALGYRGDEGDGRQPQRDPYPPYDEFGYEYRGMGGVLTNAVDLHRWVIALRGEDVLSKEAKAKFFKPFLGNYACGWEVFDFPDGRQCIGHGGSVSGFVCKLWMFPTENSLLLVLSNRDDFKYGWLNGMYDILFDVPVPQQVRSRQRSTGRTSPRTAELPSVVASDEAYLAQLAGDYMAIGNVPLKLSLKKQNGGLVASISPPAVAEEDDGFPRERKLATEVFAGLVRSEVDVIADIMAERIPKSWPGHIRSIIWPGHLATWGKLKNHQVVGSEAGQHRDSDLALIWLRLDHSEGPSTAMVGFRDGKLQLLVFDMSDYLCRSNRQEVFLQRDTGEFIAGPSRFDSCVITPQGDGQIKVTRSYGRNLTFVR